MSNAYKIVTRKIEQEYVKGQRHQVRRDIGRLAGGYYAAGELSESQMADIERAITAGSDAPKAAMREWQEAVQYGRREPVKMDEWSFDDEGGAFGWNDEVGGGGGGSKLKPIVDHHYLESEGVPAPATDYSGDLLRYLEAVFEPSDIVAYVTEAWQKEDGKWLPKRGVWDRTAQQLIDELRKAGDDLGGVIGDWKPECGAWIRINPFDGEGVRDANVTAYRHALIEADEGDLGKQLAIIRQLELPCSAIVHSGGKSIHAIVRIEAATYDEYRKRVDFLYDVAKRNGLKVDQQNRNPSRLSRMPGVDRGGQPQYMISARCGKTCWQEWEDWVADMHDALPDPESLSAVWDDLPDLAPPLIDGVLRQGHKMLLSGPSKAGKSFDLIELSIAIAEGGRWHGWQCAKGPVLYVNLELDRASALHRYKGVYAALGLAPANIGNIDIWNLRGNSVPMDRLAPKLIRRAAKKGYIAVIIDPIYKVITGDENSAEHMAKFCNQFDKICFELGSATIYAHHHSKGAQGGKRSMDRASGSGVFGRDPDALLDLIELDIPEERRQQVQNQLSCASIRRYCSEWDYDLSEVPEDAMVQADALLMEVQGRFPEVGADFSAAYHEGVKQAESMSGWRIETTLREFAAPAKKVCWFRYPVHVEDSMGLLADAKAAGEEAPWEEAQRKKREQNKQANESKKQEIIAAIADAGGPGEATVKALEDALGWHKQTVKKWIKRAGYDVKSTTLEDGKTGPSTVVEAGDE